MSLYAVKNDEGEWLGVDRNGSDHWQASHGDIYSGWFSANERASVFGGHLVELTEAPAKVVVSEEEAEMLERGKSREEYPAKFIHRYVYDSHNFSEWDYDREIRLMRAYVNGWTVEKPKRWNVKVPHTNCGWYFKCEDDENENPPILDELGCDTAGDPKNWDDSSYFTAAEIEHYGLQDCERVEIKQEEEK